MDAATIKAVRLNGSLFEKALKRRHLRPRRKLRGLNGSLFEKALKL